MTKALDIEPFQRERVHPHTHFDEFLSENNNQNGAINDIQNSQHKEENTVIVSTVVLSQSDKIHDIYDQNADPK